MHWNKGLSCLLEEAMFKMIGRKAERKVGKTHSGPAAGSNKAHSKEPLEWLRYT